eukprot:GHVO01034099.1.p1 GENE.GHVO01034099.1~~GHVO01034099.1.p1  ORF type:complete len:195 (-),score=1.53 GHVO01034099.1:143-679(-)
MTHTKSNLRSHSASSPDARPNGIACTAQLSPLPKSAWTTLCLASHTPNITGPQLAARIGSSEARILELLDSRVYPDTLRTADVTRMKKILRTITKSQVPSIPSAPTFKGNAGDRTTSFMSLGEEEPAMDKYEPPKVQLHDMSDSVRDINMNEVYDTPPPIHPVSPAIATLPPRYHPPY